MAATDRPTVTVDAELEDLIPGFLRKRREDVLRFRELLAAGQLDELRRHAHRLKGTGGSYGFPQISAIAAGLEQAACVADRDAAARAIDELAAYLAVVIVMGSSGPIEVAP